MKLRKICWEAPTLHVHVAFHQRIMQMREDGIARENNLADPFSLRHSITRFDAAARCVFFFGMEAPIA